MRYRITCQVKDAHGAQTWVVDAESEEQALELHRKGESEFEAEEVEVVSLWEPEIEEIEP